MVTLVHRLDRLRVGIEPLGKETVHHQIGEAVVEIRHESIEVLGEFRALQAGAKRVEESPGSAQQVPSACDDLPWKSGQLEPPKWQRATHRRPQHRLSAEIEKPLPGVVLPQPRVRRVAFPEDPLEQPRHRDQKRGLVHTCEPGRANPALAGPPSHGRERDVTPDAALREARRRLFQGLHS